MNHSIFEVERKPDGEIVLRFKPMLWRFSDTTKQHLLGAEREVLLAFRSMLDAAIEGTEQCQRKTADKTRTKIDIQ